MWNLSHSTKDMKLGKLLEGLKRLSFMGEETLNITDLVYHTNNVKPGSCFVAICGFKTDGHQYIEEAIAKGAKAVLVEREVKVPRGVAKIVVEDTRDAMARLAANLFSNPTLELKLVGITGTNGKTTTAFLIGNILQSANSPTGVMTTIATHYGSVTKLAERTTPESYDLQKSFREMVDAGIKNCVMEVTSHALELKRVIGCHFDGVIFTNLSADHLDFHHNMESYFASKAKLFRERLVVSEKKKLWAAINWDDSYGRTLVGGLPAKVFRFSLKEKVEVHLTDLETSWNGLKMKVQTPNGSFLLSSPLIGLFNVSNILAAVGASVAMEIPIEYIQAGIASFQGVPGRLEAVPNEQGFKIFVDYAHTPAALENVLKTLKNLGPKRIITLFGCGGDRDRLKRPMMGGAAERLSDIVVVTSDNPRSEDPLQIIEEIFKGIPREKDVYKIVDRREAIAQALALAKEGDFVLIAGKGHETYQEIAGVKKPFDDKKVVLEILEKA